MRKRFTTLLLIVGMCAPAAIAAARPDQKRSDHHSSRDDVHVTVTAGRGRLGLAVIQISPELRGHQRRLDKLERI